jgi:hypothetical protein
MERLTAYIDFNLKDSSGGSFVVPALGTSVAQVVCSDLPARSKWYSALLRAGETTAQVNLVPGHYSCSVVSELFSSNWVDLAVSSAAPVTKNISIIPYSTKVTFTLRDESGSTAIPPFNSSASIHCSDLGGRTLDIPVRPNTSTAEMNFGKGDYTCSVTGAGISSNQFDLSVTGYDSAVAVDIEVTTGDSTLTVDLFNPDTQQPVLIGAGQSAEISCWNPENGSNRYSNRYNTNASITTLYLPASSYDCSVFVYGYASSQFRVVTQSGLNTPRRVNVTTPNSYIKTYLLNESSNQPFAIPDGSSALLHCRVDQKESQGTFFSTQLNAGDTTATLGVRAGQYRCSLWLPEYGSSEFTVSATNGNTTEASTRIYPESNVVTVNVIDKTTGQPISDIPIRVSAFTRTQNSSSDRLRHWQEVSSTDGTATLNLVAAQEYDLNVRLDDSPDADLAGLSRTLVLSNDLINLKTLSTGTPQTVTIEAYETNTFIEVSLLYPDGTPVERGWAEISSIPSSSTEQPDWKGERISKGTAKLAVVPGVNYEVNAYPDINGKTVWISQKSVLVNPNAGETKEVTLTLSKPDYELDVSIEIKGSPPSSVTPSVFCYAFDSSGRQSFAEADASLKAIIPIVRGSDTEPLEVSCSAHYSDISSEYGVSFWGSSTYIPSSLTTAGSLKVELGEYGRHYGQEAYTFDAAYGAFFTLPDGTTTVEIPAKAVANSGTATMYVGSPTGYSFERDNFPLTGFEIKFQVDGKIVSDMTLPVTLRFQVDDAQLERVGGSIEKLKAGSFDDGSRVWKEDANCSYDASTKVFSVKVTHFSIWGLLVDLLANLTGSPTPTPTPTEVLPESTPTPGYNSSLIPYDLTAKLIRKEYSRKKAKAGGGGNYRYKVCWKAPYGVSSRTTYELQMLLQRKSKKKRKAPSSLSTDVNWNKGKIVKTKKTCVTRELESGIAHARVRIKDGEYSSTISFRTGR